MIVRKYCWYRYTADITLFDTTYCVTYVHHLRIKQSLKMKRQENDYP